MGKGGIGVGSASIVLIFAVLCLTIFSLITFMVAGNDKALADVRVELVTGYYEADALAELILAELMSAETVPASIQGIDINIGWDDTLDTETLFYFCPISDIKALYVSLVIRDNSFDILSWRLYSIDEWEFDTSINIWTGE
jgi:hypothetical protein